MMKKLINGVEIEMTPDEIEEMERFWATPLSIELYQSALNEFINNKASERQYDNAMAISSYVNSTNAQWASEANAFIAWRDAVYLLAIDTLNKVQSGEMPQPTIDDFLSQLPEIEWPDVG
jgi:hypothetical protein